TDRSAANADNKETITVTLTPRDSHNNVVPLWTFRKDLTIVPSVNATVPGAVTVTTPAQDATGNVTATLTYVDTSGQLLSKAARAGTTTVIIGSVVKKSVDTRFYPAVHVCLTGLDSNGFVTPGTTEVHICDGSGHTIPSGSGYTVTAPGISSSGCPTDGGGVCPSDAAGGKADFTNLTGDDILTLASTRITFHVHDVYAAQDVTSSFNTGEIAFYGELRHHKPATNLGTTADVWHTGDAQSYCHSAVRRVPVDAPGVTLGVDIGYHAAIAATSGSVSGGSTSADTTMATLHMGAISNAITTGGDTNPEIFVSGNSRGSWFSADCATQCIGEHEVAWDGVSISTQMAGAYLPSALVFVNGSRHAATYWAAARDKIAERPFSLSRLWAIGDRLPVVTNWNLSDSFFVNNWPGTPYTAHKGNGDSSYPFVTQVNYITGYICAASLH
ncbi:hypothetical protein H8P76_004877, partial [Salmonella enterica]|nr:hypothetical protein [Salmonella enterica]